MKKLFPLFAPLVVILFFLIPFPSSDLILEFSFREISGNSCQLYYAVDGNDFLGAQYLNSEIDYTKKTVSFRLSSELETHLSNLRLDLPNQDQLLSICDVRVSSGGFIQKNYNPCVFFGAENLSGTHSAAPTYVLPKKTVYFETSSDDPYIVLTPEFTSQLTKYYSQRRFSRVFLGFFLLCTYWISKKKLWTASLPDQPSTL